MRGQRPRPFWWRLVTQTLEELAQARADLLACALAFQCLLSIAPLLIVAVALAGFVLGRGEALAEVDRLLENALGPAAGGTVRGWVQEASRGGAVASFVGLGLTAWAASRLGSGLRDALNQLWNIDVVMSKDVKSSITDYLRHRLSALLIVSAAAPLLLAVFASRTLLTAFHTALFASSPGRGIAIQLIQLAGSFSIVALVSAAVFHYVPGARTTWKDVLVGGALTSLLFNVGNALVGFYLGIASVTAAYGAAGSVVVVLLWLYFSAHTFLIGGKFTHVYAQHSGGRLELVAGAKKSRSAPTAETRRARWR
jgi:membrane protein